MWPLPLRSLIFRACSATLFTPHAAWAGWATRLAGPLLGSSKPAPRSVPHLVWRAHQRGLRHKSFKFRTGYC